MAIAHYDIDIDKGVDASITLTLKNSSGTVIDLTGCTAKMQVKSNLSSDYVIDTLSTESSNGRITIGGSNGNITLIFPHTATEEYPSMDLVYDLISIKNNIYTKVVEGRIRVSETITNV